MMFFLRLITFKFEQKMFQKKSLQKNQYVKMHPEAADEDTVSRLLRGS